MSLETIFALADRSPEAPAFISGDTVLSRRQLVGRIALISEALLPSSPIVGLMADDGVDWVAAMLALEALGRTIVPIPTFFSSGQLGHIIADAGIETIVSDEGTAQLLSGTGIETVTIPEGAPDGKLPELSAGSKQILYTSGSTGTPKGVELPADHLWSRASALAGAVEATEADRYLSLLPLSLLLEQITAIRAPLLVGARTFFAPGPTADPRAMIEASEIHRPTVTTLVPELLKLWVVGLKSAGLRAPDSLRFVAVGGAPVPDLLAEEAWALGLPVHEGYGLTECGSVVTLNHPGKRLPGTVGTPLKDTSIRIEDGEIVIHGATVMPAAGMKWHTGDLGEIDAEGFLKVHGRKDSRLQLASGRNLQPEWIESLILADPRAIRCLAFGTGRAKPAVILETITPDSAEDLISQRLATLPEYAKPDHVTALPPGGFAALGLITPSGRIRRTAATAHFAGTIKEKELEE